MNPSFQFSLTTEEMYVSFLKYELSGLMNGANYLDIIIIYKSINTHEQPVCIGLKYPQHKHLFAPLINNPLTEIGSPETNYSFIKYYIDYGNATQKIDESYKEMYVVRVEEYQLVDLFVQYKNPPLDDIKATRRMARKIMKNYFEMIRSSGKNHWTIGESEYKQGEITFFMKQKQI
ncbi:hypothetical protein QTN25_008938 [Entamoeba marina]